MFTAGGGIAARWPILLKTLVAHGRFVRLDVERSRNKGRVANVHLGRPRNGRRLPPVFIGGRRAIQPYYERLGPNGEGRWCSHECGQPLVCDRVLQRPAGKPADEYHNKRANRPTATNGHIRPVRTDTNGNEPRSGPDGHRYGPLYQWHKRRRERESGLVDGPTAGRI